MTKARVAAIVLAAGQGTRFAAAADGALKLLAIDRGEPLVRKVVHAASQSGARPVFVVTGHARDAVQKILVGLEYTEIYNPDFSAGLSTSLRAGIASLASTDEGALVLLADMPRVSTALLDSLIEAFSQDTDVAAVIPTFEGRRGNPVLLARALFSSVATLSGDEGARRLLTSARHIRELPVADASVTIDIDTPDALRVIPN